MTEQTKNKERNGPNLGTVRNYLSRKRKWLSEEKTKQTKTEKIIKNERKM